MADKETLVFRASLTPKIYRDIELVEAGTLSKLAEAVVISFGFDFNHAFGFYSKLKGHFYDSPRRFELFVDIGEGDAGAKGVERTRATEAFPSIGSKMLMLFDYGDEWLFLIELIDRKPREAKVRLPRVLASVGKAPEQYPSFEDDEDDEEEA